MTDELPAFTLRAAAGLPVAYGPLNDAVIIVVDAQEEYAEADRKEIFLTGLDNTLN